MSRRLRKVLAIVLPAPVLAWWRLRFGWKWFRGSYASWSEARRACAGYEETSILHRVISATRAARSRPGCWERDGFVFHQPEPNQPLLAALAEIAAEAGGAGVAVVDFGGSLGSTWWQHRAELRSLGVRRWLVVEQRHFAEAGQEFADEELDFSLSLETAVQAAGCHVLLLSGVLPYLEDPRALLDDAVRLGFRHVLIDRTPFARDGASRLVLQHTPPGLGGGTYPVWLRSEGELLAPLVGTYTVRARWDALDRLAVDVHHGGFHFVRNA